MITQLDFTWNEEHPFCIWAEDFPIDLQKDNYLWLDNFRDLFNSGEYYMPEKGDHYDNCIEKHGHWYTQVKVIDICYGKENDKIVKIITVEAQ